MAFCRRTWASEAGPEICKWVLEQHNDAMDLEIDRNNGNAGDVPGGSRETGY
jgi:hypothetical protein